MMDIVIKVFIMPCSSECDRKWILP